MRTSGGGGDILMLVVPIAVSFGLLVVMSGGIEGFMTIVDVAVREAAVVVISWVRSL